MRDFEKISFKQFAKNIRNDISLYLQFPLPKRDSDSSAGYNIYLLEDLILSPHEI